MMKINDRHTVRNNILYTLIYIMFFVSLFINVKTGYIGGDDPFTLGMSRHNFLTIIGLTSQDVHPFLYYFLARIFILPFNNTFSQIVSLKILSALPYLILLLIGNITIRRKFSLYTSLLFMFLIISMPIISQNIFIARMYGWSLLFVTLVFLLLFYVYKDIINNSLENFSYITLFSLSALYTHYYCLIIVFILYLVFLLAFIYSNKKVKYLMYSFIITYVLYLPWLKIMLKQVSVVHNNYWSSPIDTNFINLLHMIIKLILNIFYSDYSESNIIKIVITLFILITMISILVFIYKYIHFNISIIIILSGFLLPVIIIFAGIFLSIIEKHQVFQPRYLAPTLGVFWLCVSIILSMLLKNHNLFKAFKVILMVIIVIIGFKSYYSNITQLTSFYNQFRYTQLTFKHIPYNARIIYDEPQVLTQTSIYLRKDKVYTLGDIYNGKPIGNPLVYRKVLQNDYIKHNIALNTKRHHYFFVKTFNNKGDNILSKKFFNKYKYQLHKIGNIYTPLASKESIVYHIK